MPAASTPAAPPRERRWNDIQYVAIITALVATAAISASDAASAPAVEAPKAKLPAPEPKPAPAALAKKSSTARKATPAKRAPKPAVKPTAIKLAKSIEPTHPRIAVLEAQIAREADRTQSAQQEQARADAASQKLASLIKLGNERLGQDKLIEPTGDSARYYFTTARELDSGSSLPQQGLRSLGNKMLQKSSAAAARGDLVEAEQWLTQARGLGVSGIDFTKADRDLKNGQRAKSGEAGPSGANRHGNAPARPPPGRLAGRDLSTPPSTGHDPISRSDGAS